MQLNNKINRIRFFSFPKKSEYLLTYGEELGKFLLILDWAQSTQT